jgi:hypothetical protein
MMEAASTSETSENFYRTARRNIPEDSNLHGGLLFNYRSAINRKAILQLIPITPYICSGKSYKTQWDILNTLN